MLSGMIVTLYYFIFAQPYCAVGDSLGTLIMDKEQDGSKRTNPIMTPINAEEFSLHKLATFPTQIRNLQHMNGHRCWP